MAGFPEADTRDGATKGADLGYHAGGSATDRVPIAVRATPVPPPAFSIAPRRRPKSAGRGNDHPTVKPVALLVWLVRLVTPPGGLVLDPFLGSGSTGIAAEIEQRPFVGIELQPDYLAIAERRLVDRAGLFAEVVVDRAAA